MRFDDRIRTVLNHPVANDRDRAVRWRQLIDLLSRARVDSDPDLVAQALEMALADRDTVPPPVRAATARAIAGRPVDQRLVALFAADRLEVAAPLLAAATLDEAGRAEVEAVASEEVRRLFFALGHAPSPKAEPPLELTERVETPASVRDIIAKLEHPVIEPALEIPEPVAPAAPRAEEGLFRWESDPAGTIFWVEGAPRASIIGRALSGHPAEALMDTDQKALLVRRSPFIDLPMNRVAALDGDWRISGAPAFSPAEGRFVGYRGIARRIDLERKPAKGRRSRRTDDADALRELVHEIKTPLNAIIGFAEIIDGQFLGPAHRSYRSRAASIVSQARSLLAAVEDLDLAAKLEREGKKSTGAGTEFADAFPPIAEALNAYGASRGIGLVFQLEGRFTRCALAPELAERMVRRFVTAIIDAAADKESLSVRIAPHKGKCAIGVKRPAALLDVIDSSLFDPHFGAGEGGPIGIGFAFRLVRGLAQTVGGDLVTDDEQFMLLLPAKR